MIWKHSNIFLEQNQQFSGSFVYIIMEFADLIKISRVDNVRLRRPSEDPCEVTVAVTGHHLILSIEVSQSLLIIRNKDY